MIKDLQYYKFCLYGFLKNLRFFEPFLLLFFIDNGITFFQVGILFAIKEIIRTVFEIPAGIIADSFGRKRSMIISFSLYIVSFSIYFLSSNFYFFAFAISVYGIGDAFRTGTHKAMIYDYLDVKGWTDFKVDYYGNTRSWSQFGSAISSLIAATMVIITKDYRHIFIFSIIPYLIDIINLSSYPSFLNGYSAKFSWKKLRVNTKKVLLEFKSSFQNRTNLRAILSSSSYSSYYEILKDFLQPVLQTLALSIPIFEGLVLQQRSAIVVGIVYFFIYLLTSLASRNSAKISRRFQNLTIVVNLTLLVGVFFGFASGILYHSQLLILSVISYMAVLIIENIRKPVNMSLIAGLTNKNALASVLSVESQTKTIFVLIFSPSFGFIADKFGLGISISVLSVILLGLYPIIHIKTKNNNITLN